MTKIGITINNQVKDHNQLFFSAGVNQNVLFLARAIDTPNNKVGIINSDMLARYGYPSMSIDEAQVIIELGLKLNHNELERFKARSNKLVSYMAGTAMVMNLECIASGRETGEQPEGTDPKWYDACWITPQHWEMNRDYVYLTRCENVSIAPHVWEPTFLIDSAKEFGTNLSWKPGPWKPGVFEPNINVVKTFHYPLLVAEHCYRQNPDLMDHVFLFNTAHLTGQPHFDSFVNALSIKPKLSVESRLPTAEALKYCNAVITHNWNIELNYLYWDCLYGGFPLIHNSSFDAGYKYDSFDAKSGGVVLEQALLSHYDNWVSYTYKAQQYLDTLSPTNLNVRQCYKDLLEQL